MLIVFEIADKESTEWAAEFGLGEATTLAAPSVTIGDLKEALLLVEVWKGEVVRGELRKSGIQGEVRRRLAPYGLLSARFRVLPSSVFVVNACLQTASLSRAHSDRVVSSDSEFEFSAKLSGSPMDAIYLRYS